MCINPPLTKRFLKPLPGELEHIKHKHQSSGCISVNLYFQDERMFGLLTILRRKITAKGIKPVAPFLHRFDNLYLFGAFSPFTGAAHLLEMPCCNSEAFQVYIDFLSVQDPAEYKILILDNGAFHHAKKLNIPANISLIFLPPYSPELNPAEKMWRYFKDNISMVAYNKLEDLQNKITELLKNTTNKIVKSICGNQFYIHTFNAVFNV